MVKSFKIKRKAGIGLFLTKHCFSYPGLNFDFETILKPFLFSKIFLFFIFFLTGSFTPFSTPVQAQFLQSSMITPSYRPDPQQIGLSLNSTSFFHNNEFFHPLEKGYTLTGTWIQPEITYAFNEVFTASAGLHLLKYHGIESFSRTLPVFSFTWLATESVSFTLGNFYGGQNHRLSEVIFNPERHLRSFPEGGMSIQLKKNKVESEFWIDWERMIFHGDPFNEEVTAGSSTLFKLRDSGDESGLTIPLQVLARHRGGQINTGDRSVDTWWNMLTGIEAMEIYEEKLFRELRFMLHFPVYYYEGETGFGIYPQIGTEIFGNKISLGYFRASGFKTIHGIGLYDSYKYNTLSGNYTEGGTSHLISFKTGFSKNIHQQVSLVSRLDAWYDLKRSKIDYMSGLYLIVSLNSPLRKMYRERE